MKTQLSRYLNGNYYVEVYDDGTKVKVLADNKAKEFIPAFPDSVILKLTHFSQTSEQLVAIAETIVASAGERLNSLPVGVRLLHIIFLFSFRVIFW